MITRGRDRARLTLILRTLNPLEHAVFQRVFGEIMTLLNALEFNHTMQCVITRERGIIQGKIVILIAQLALARKVIVTDPYEVPPLGATYWLLRDDPTGGADGPQHPPASAAPQPQVSVCRRCNTTGGATAILPHVRAPRLRPASCCVATRIL